MSAVPPAGFTERRVLWVSDVTGGNRRIVLILPNENFGQVQWLPDGKHISFVCDGTLYVRPIP